MISAARWQKNGECYDGRACNRVWKERKKKIESGKKRAQERVTATETTVPV